LIDCQQYKILVHEVRHSLPELKDYKFFCFNGIPRFMYVSNDLSENARTDFFDMDYNRLDMRMKDPNSEHPAPKPDKFEEMKFYAEVLCKNHSFIRVDFYVVNGVVYFGELTFYHNAGFFKIHPESWNIKLGNLLELPC